MATTFQRDERQSGPPRAIAFTAGGAAAGTIGGIAVMALAILALAGVIPRLLVPIGGIVFGVAMLAEAMGIASDYSGIADRVAHNTTESVEVGGGTGAEFLVGLAAVALGILSLVGVAAPTLMPALVITGGTGLVLSAGTTERLNDLHLASTDHSETMRRVARGAVAGGAAAQTLGGIGAIVLGILALVAVSPAAAEGGGSLIQVGLLVLGASVALSGGAITGKLARLTSAA